MYPLSFCIANFDAKRAVNLFDRKSLSTEIVKAYGACAKLRELQRDNRSSETNSNHAPAGKQQPFPPREPVRFNMTRREKEHNEKTCPLDANIYATRKTVAQGMMDIALLTANASQLKHVLATADTHDYYLISLVLIASSMTLQILVGILLVVVGRWNINRRKEQNIANITNNVIVILIFLITVVNVLITAFGDEDTDLGDWEHARLNNAESRLERELKSTVNSTPRT